MSITHTVHLLRRPCILCTEFIAFLAASLSPTFADEQEMRAALARISQQEAEYRAALSLATTDEQRAAIIPPSADEAAAALWKSVRSRTGTKEVPVTSPTSLRRAENAKPPATRQVPTYEFEEDWAAPAVVWLLNHPDALAKLFPDAPQKLTQVAHHLLHGVLGGGVVVLPLGEGVHVGEEMPDDGAESARGETVDAAVDGDDASGVDALGGGRGDCGSEFLTEGF